MFSATSVFQTVLEALREEPLNIIATVGSRNDPADLGAQPENVHVERYIPQSQLLPHCDLLISHAGSGATLGTPERRGSPAGDPTGRRSVRERGSHRVSRCRPAAAAT